MDRKTRKIVTMYGPLHDKSDVDRLYLARSKCGRGLISCERCVRSEENSLGWCVKNLEEDLPGGVKVTSVIEYEQSVESEEFKKQKEGEGVQEGIGRERISTASI